MKRDSKLANTGKRQNSCFGVLSKILWEIGESMSLKFRQLGEWLIFTVAMSLLPLLVNKAIVLIGFVMPMFGISVRTLGWQDWIYILLGLVCAQQRNYKLLERGCDKRTARGRTIANLAQIGSGAMMVLVVTLVLVLGVGYSLSEMNSSYGTRFCYYFALIIIIWGFIMNALSTGIQQDLPARQSKIDMEKIRGFFPPDTDADEIEETIIRLLERWKNGEDE